MQRTTVLLFCLVLVFTAAASESFTLNVPLRFNTQQETGEVRIVLDLNAAPAGSQLVVDGTTTLNLGDTTAIGGDSITFAGGTGNAARIIYKPLSNFGTDFCDAAGATEKNVVMRFVGAPDIVSYRLSTYVVGAPSAECSKVSKRTNDAPANIIPTGDGVAPDLTALFKGRLPLDVVLVLDKSGSMAGLPPGAVSGASKAEILTAAASAFVSQWRLIDEETPEGIEFSEDRLGVVFFDSAAAAQSIPGADAPANFFVRRGPGGPGPAHQWNAVINTIGTLAPGGATSVGGGVNTAMAQWVADPDHDLFLIVVTDGIQNTLPLITAAGSGFLGLLPVSGLDAELRKRFIPIQTVGFGTPASVDADLLTNLALETSGVSYITINDFTTFDTFGFMLVGVLKGNTASLAMRKKDSLSGVGPSAPHPVLVDASAQRAVFSLQWAPPMRNAFDLEVFRPDGSLAVPSSAEKLPQAALQAFDLDRRKDLGNWTARVKRAKGSNAGPLAYNLNVFFLERDLDYRLSFDTIRARTGDAIRLRANVTYDGKPLTGLPASAIRARVLGPTDALGTILHDTKVNGGIGSSVTPAGDVLTAYDRKLAALGRRVLDRVTPREVATISLKEEKNGAYAATFDKTTIPGTYAFEVTLDWDHPRTGRVHRVERIEQIVRVAPDPAKSTIVTSRSGNLVRIRVTPRDRFGNFLGPGYASLVKARLNGGGKIVERPPMDHDNDGTYEFPITQVPLGKMPDVDIFVDGVRIGNILRPNG
jgi:hypothetical protein